MFSSREGKRERERERERLSDEQEYKIDNERLKK